MNVNEVASAAPLKEVRKPKKVAKAQVLEQPQEKTEAKPMPSAELMQAMVGVKKLGRPEPIKYTPQTAENFLKNHPADKFLRKEDRANIKKVMCKGNVEASNIQMQLKLVADGDLEPSTLQNYWETGKMSDNLAKDIDMVYEAKKAGKNVNDVYVPTVKSKTEGHKTVKVGDVFQVEGEDKVYVKANDKESRQLDMDKDMFIKMFPPAKRFTTQQQHIGDCYLVSTLNTLMQNPKARVAMYEAIHQDGDDVKVKFKKGFGEYTYKNAELPADRVKAYSLSGAMGVRILEDAYGVDSINKADHAFKTIMNERIAKKEEELKTATGDKKAELQKSLDGHKQRLNDYLAAKADPVKGKDIVVCRDDNYFNIYYEEDENGLKFAELSKDPDNKDLHYESPADFYRGSLGGYNFEVLQRFGFGGFRQMNLDLETDKVKDMISKDNFNEDYIMTGGTRAGGSRVENPVAKSAGIYGFHAYTLEPHKDEKGDLKMRCTNPWNTSYDADISYKDFLKYYDSVSIIDVNSYGKDLPLEEQPIKYGKNGAIVGDNSNDKEVTWYINGNKKPVDMSNLKKKV